MPANKSLAGLPIADSMANLMLPGRVADVVTPLLKNHRLVYRPWGHYENIYEGEFNKVKRITVNAGASLSTQMHQHRAEHWVVVNGTAEVIKGSETFTLEANQSIYLPQGVVHSLANKTNTPLEIIEVQTGNYLEEDDIIRLEDKYGRNVSSM